MKKLFYIFWSIAGLIVVLMVVSYFFERHLGSDLTELQVKSPTHQFESARDEQGVWKIEVSKVEDLWFALGYLHMWDRESQMEFLRASALGKLASIAGEKALSQDRIMRAGARASQVEWESLDEKSLSRRAAEAYVAGVEHYRKSVDRPEPVEFRALGLERLKMESWSPVDLLAIARFQAWQFSFDLDHEIFAEKLKFLVGEDALSFYLPKNNSDLAHYAQRDMRSGVRKMAKSSFANLPPFYLPNSSLGPIENRDVSKVSKLQSQPLLDLANFSPENSTWAQLAASNLWVLKSSSAENPRPLTLCNDTHLGLSWPSPMYPVKYDLDARLSAVGFSLPGVPAIVLGSIESREGRRMAWGVTLGNYADTQDLVVTEGKESPALGISKEVFLVRDRESGRLEAREEELRWTALGLDVSTSYQEELKVLAKKSPATSGPKNFYLDWTALRKLSSPLEFYLRRNLFLQENLEADLINLWGYPAVNFSWIEEDKVKGQKAGHMLTGLHFTHARKTGTISPREGKSRRLRHSGANEFFYRDLTKESSFFSVSANQRTSDSEIFNDIAYSWEPSDRARRILDQEPEILKTVESAQTDYHPPVVVEFYRRAQALVKANELCQKGKVDEREFCFLIWRRLAKWSSLAQENSWEMSVLALWISLSKQALFPKSMDWTDAESLKVFSRWVRMSFSDRTLLGLLANDRDRQIWEKKNDQKLSTLLGETYSEALRLLIEKRGPASQNWLWGSLHRIDWSYALGDAPEPFGKILEDSILGPPPSVGGGFDSPGSFEFRWSPESPVEFPAVHGAAMRACYAFEPGTKTSVRWAVPNGPSGNPFSIWSRRFASQSYFRKKLLNAR